MPEGKFKQCPLTPPLYLGDIIFNIPFWSYTFHFLYPYTLQLQWSGSLFFVNSNNLKHILLKPNHPPTQKPTWPAREGTQEESRRDTGTRQRGPWLPGREYTESRLCIMCWDCCVEYVLLGLYVTRERACTGTRRDITIPNLKTHLRYSDQEISNIKTDNHPQLTVRVLRLPKVPCRLMRLISERRE